MARSNGHNKGATAFGDASGLPDIETMANGGSTAAGASGTAIGEGKGLFAKGKLEGLLQDVDQSTLATFFVSAGKDARELFARTKVKDDNEINKFVIYFERCRKYHITNGVEMLQNKLALRKSVNGLSLDQILQLGTGTLRPRSPAFSGKSSEPKESNERP